MHTGRRNLLTRAAAALAGLPARGVQAQAARPGLLFGVIAPRAAEQTQANWLPFVQRLAAALGQGVELRVFETSGAMVQAFRAGSVDVGWMGNAPALEVVEAGAGSVFAQMVTRDGGLGYKSVLVVPAASPLRTLDDVLARARGLRFGDGDPKSTSGFLVPLYFAFQKNGIDDTRQAFRAVEVGSHQQNLRKVAEGRVDVATANDEELAFFARDFPALADRVRVVWASPLIPQSPLLWRTGLPPGLKERIRAFVVGFGAARADERAVLVQMNNLARFRPSSNLQLVPIADLEMFKARQAIDNDRSLAAPERARRVDDVIRRGSRLEMRLKLAG